MIIISGTISIDPASRDAFLVASAPLQKATRDDEPGCLAYVFSADPVEPEQIVVYELWSDAASLEAHFLHPNYTNTRAMLGQHGSRGAVVRKYRTDADAPVYNAERIATASFDDA